MPEFFEEFNKIRPPIGVVPGRNLVNSSFRPSPIQTGEEPVYLPSVLNEYALLNGVRKMVCVKVALGETLMSEIYAVMWEKFGKIWRGSQVLSVDEVLKKLTTDKSPAYPYYYMCNTKRQAIQKYWAHIKDQLVRLLKSEGYSQLFTATLKNELLHKDKVEAEKTRVFQNGTLPLLLFGMMLFCDMEQKTADAFGFHDSTIGISIPSPEFIQLFLGLGEDYKDFLQETFEEGLISEQEYHELLKPQTFDDDKELFVLMMDDDGNWYEFATSASYYSIVRDIRKACLPKSFSDCVDHYYDKCYAGEVVILGNIYRMIMQKSGQLLTGADNSAIKSCQYYPALRDYLGNEPVKQYVNRTTTKSNGDDGNNTYQLKKKISLRKFVVENAFYNLFLSTQSGATSDALRLMFLSHSIKWRHLQWCNMDILTAAARLDKLKSALSFEQSKDDAINAQRFFAILNGMWPYEQAYDKCFQAVYVDWYLKHPRYLNHDPVFVVAGSSLLEERDLAYLHSGAIL